MEFEGAKHEIRRLSEELEVLNSQVCLFTLVLFQVLNFFFI